MGHLINISLLNVGGEEGHQEASSKPRFNNKSHKLKILQLQKACNHLSTSVCVHVRLGDKIRADPPFIATGFFPTSETCTHLQVYLIRPFMRLGPCIKYCYFPFHSEILRNRENYSFH